MKTLQEVFNQIQSIKNEQKTVKTAYRDALSASAELAEAGEQLKALKEKKKKIEAAIKEQFTSDLDKLERLKTDIESQNTMLADIALTKLMGGETVEVVDVNSNVYEPVFSVRFKKTSAMKHAAAKKSDTGQPAGRQTVPEINRMFD